MFTEYLQDGVDQETSKRKYGPDRDRLAWKLSELTSQARGRIVEKAVVRELERRGFTGVEHIGGTNPFDIATDQGQVEVKSSLINSHGEGFLFQRIEPRSFDLLVLVAIHPDWIEIKTMSRGEAWNMVNGSKSISVTQKRFATLDEMPEMNYTTA